MKKNIFVSFMALCAALSVSAANTASVNITISDGNKSDKVRIAENSQFTKGFDSGYDSPQPDANVPGIYVVDGTSRYTDWATDDMEGIYIGIIAGTATNYTLSFANLKGDYKLYDYGTFTLYEMTSDINITLTASQRVDNRFQIVKNTPTFSYKREVATNNWGTMCYPDSITAVEGAVVYQITAMNSAKTKVAVDAVDVLNMKPGKAYLFNATADAQTFTYFPGKAVVDSIQNNGLIGTFNGLTLATEKWVLTGNMITPAAATSTVKQYRCYIDLSLTPVDDTKFNTSAPGRKIFNVKNTPTELENVNANVNANGKMMIDGQLVIIRDGKMFNAQGVQL